MLRELLTVYEKTAPDTWDRYECEALLGASLEGQKKFDEAERLLLAGYDGMMRRQASVPVPDRAGVVAIRRNGAARESLHFVIAANARAGVSAAQVCRKPPRRLNVRRVAFAPMTRPSTMQPTTKIARSESPTVVAVRTGSGSPDTERRTAFAMPS